MRRFIKKVKRNLKKPVKAAKKLRRRSIRFLKKGVQAWLILACIMIAAPVGFGAYWVMSNMLSVTVRDYALVLEVSDANPLRYQDVTFTATLTLAGHPVGSATIFLDRDGVEIDNAITGVGGQCDFIVNMTDTANFQARFQAGIIE